MQDLEVEAALLSSPGGGEKETHKQLLVQAKHVPALFSLPFFNPDCRLQAEADFFSSVSLSDFNTVCTLGMGGFSRVELVS